MNLNLLLWIVLFISVYANNFDDVTENTLKSQMTVESNSLNWVCVAVRFNTSTLVASLYKRNADSSVRSSFSRYLLLDHALVAIVSANDSDARLVHQGCVAYDSEYRLKNGVSISASLLALRLSDDAQSSLQHGDKPLAYNCLIMSTDECLEQHSGLGNIFKVDMSGNFESCRAVSIGYKSARINSWLETRGVFIASEILSRLRVNASRDDWCPSLSDEENMQLSDSSDVRSCFSILWKCLHENFGLTNIQQNFTVEISTIQQSRRTSYFKRPLPRVGHFVRPCVVPSEVFNNGTSSTLLATPLAGEGYSDQHHQGSNRLFRWWKLKRDSEIAARKSGMSLQWRKLM